MEDEEEEGRLAGVRARSWLVRCCTDGNGNISELSSLPKCHLSPPETEKYKSGVESRAS